MPEVTRQFVVAGTGRFSLVYQRTSQTGAKLSHLRVLHLRQRILAIGGQVGLRYIVGAWWWALVLNLLGPSQSGAEVPH